MDEDDFSIDVDGHEIFMSILHNALHSGLDLSDLICAAEHARTIGDLDDAVSLLGMGAINTDMLGDFLKG